MKNRALAIGLFGLLTLAEIGDLAGLIVTLGDPAPAAAQLGISPRAETIRAIILLAFALIIALNSAIALLGALLRHALMVQFGALMAGVGLVFYGLYQIGSAFFQHGQLLYAGVGAIYLALAALAFRFARSGTPRPAPAQPKPEVG